jgi:hypothetical protein
LWWTYSSSFSDYSYRLGYSLKGEKMAVMVAPPDTFTVSQDIANIDTQTNLGIFRGFLKFFDT